MWYIIRESSIIRLNIDRAISSVVPKLLHIPMRWHYDIMSPSNDPACGVNITSSFFPLFWPLDQFSLGVFSMVGSYTVNIVGGVVQRLPSTGNNKDHDSGPQVGTVSIYTISLREKITLSWSLISRSESVNLVPINQSLRTFSCYVYLWTRLGVNAWENFMQP